MPNGVRGRNTYRIAIGVAVIVAIALAFLGWQAVMQAAIPRANFTEDYCLGLLAIQIPEANETGLASNPFENGTLNSVSIQRDNNESVAISAFYISLLSEQPMYCSAEASTYSGLSFAWSGSYMCDQTTYRYRIEENANWLGLAVQTETPNLFYVNGTLIINMSEVGAPRFTDVVSYFDPIDLVSKSLWANQSEMMRRRVCV